MFYDKVPSLALFFTIHPFLKIARTFSEKKRTPDKTCNSGRLLAGGIGFQLFPEFFLLFLKGTSIHCFSGNLRMNPINGKNWTFRRRLKNQKVINRGAHKHALCVGRRASSTRLTFARRECLSRRWKRRLPTVPALCVRRRASSTQLTLLGENVFHDAGSVVS